MNNREQVIADSTSLLKDDPRVADAILNPAPLGTRAARNVTAIKSLIVKQMPSTKSPPADPFEFLQRALRTILYGQYGRGISLGTIVDLTNRHCPLTKTYFALREACASITDITEMRQAALNGWSPSQAKALGDREPGPTREMAHLGYRIDALRLRQAADELGRIERESRSPVDPRRGVAHLCFSLVVRSLREVRAELHDAGDDWLELLATDGAPGTFSIRTIPPQYAAEGDDDQRLVTQKGTTRPAFKPLEELLAWLEERLDERSRSGMPVLAHADALRLIDAEVPHLYRFATKAHAVADVHLAIRAIVERSRHDGSAGEGVHSVEAPSSGDDG